MRRLLIGACVALTTANVFCTSVLAQFYQQRNNVSAADPGAVNRVPGNQGTVTGGKVIGATVNPAPNPVPAQPNDPNPGKDNRDDRQRGDRGGRDDRDRRDRPNNRGPIIGVPIIVNPGFVPVYPSYVYPTYIPPPSQLQPIPGATLPTPREEPEPAAPKEPKTTNADLKARAGKYIGYGDTNFANQKYHAASERYRTAAEIAPDLPESFLRQGFAAVAMGQYDTALKSFRRALKVRGDWTDSAFRLNQLYEDDQISKTAHLENLAKAVEANPLDAGLLTTLGIELYFDGQRDRAGVFFARAAQLGGNEDQLLNALLTQPGPKGAEAKPANPKVVF